MDYERNAFSMTKKNTSSRVHVNILSSLSMSSIHAARAEKIKYPNQYSLMLPKYHCYL